MTPEVLFVTWLGVFCGIVVSTHAPIAVGIGLSGLGAVFVMVHAFQSGRLSATAQWGLR